MSKFKELAMHDPRMRRLLLVGIVFVFGPPLFSFFQDPWGWKGDQLRIMLIAFGAPWLVIAGLFISRWRKLTRLSARGVQVPAVVEKTWSNREGQSAAVRYRLNGVDYQVTVPVPNRHWMIDEGASATLLVDPQNPKNASIVDVRSSLMEVRDRLAEGNASPKSKAS